MGHRLGRRRPQPRHGRPAPTEGLPEHGQGLEVGEQVDRAALGDHVGRRRQLDEPFGRDLELGDERGGPGRVADVVHQLEGVGQLGEPEGPARSDTRVLLPLAWVPETTMRTSPQSRTRSAQAATAPAAATLSESTPPAIGMRTVRSTAATVRRDSPSPSVPSTRASRSGGSAASSSSADRVVRQRQRRRR